MKCLVIEDEKPAQELLLRYISQKPDVECLGVFDSIKELPLVVLGQVDFIFLDIQLPGIDGLNFLKTLETKPKVIITTAYRDYAVDAFEEAVCDYLLKPFSYERFLKAVMRIYDTVSNEKTTGNSGNELILYADKSYYKIAKSDIHYLKSEVDYVHIHYSDKKLLVQDTLKDLEAKLPEENFIRVHRSYLINFQKLVRVEGNQISIGEVKIPIGKTYKADFFKRIK